MKNFFHKILYAALLFASLVGAAWATSYPSPTFLNLIVTGTVTIDSYLMTFPAAAAHLAALDIADQTLSGGMNLTVYNIGSVSSGTQTVDCGKNPSQYLLNAGAFTLAAPTTGGTCFINIINGPGAGAVTLSGFSASPSGNGDTFATTSTASGTATFTNGSAVIGYSNSFVAGQHVYFTTSGSLPTNFSANTIYYVIATGLSSSQFEVAATQSGSAIVAGSAGSGTQTVTEPSIFTAQVWRIDGLSELIWKQVQ